MQFLKKMFGGGGDSEDKGIYIYVQCDNCEEIVQLRLEPQYELVQSKEGGFRSHKTVVDARCFREIDARFVFDSNQKLTDAYLQGGTLSDRATYDAQEAEREKKE